MPDWMWFFVALAVGGAALAGAVALDARARRRRTGTGQPAPHRGIEDVDRNVPTYLTQDEIDAMAPPSDGGAALRHEGEGFAFGHAHPDFATGPAGAAWAQPRLLIVDGAIGTTRELLAPLTTATPESPLIIVAADISEEVIVTLAANRRALRRPVVAAVADDRERLRLAELTGATALTADDLRAGYVPDEALGQAKQWSSNLKQTWVNP